MRGDMVDSTHGYAVGVSGRSNLVRKCHLPFSALNSVLANYSNTLQGAVWRYD